MIIALLIKVHYMQQLLLIIAARAVVSLPSPEDPISGGSESWFFRR